jgi:glutaredoxin
MDKIERERELNRLCQQRWRRKLSEEEKKMMNKVRYKKRKENELVEKIREAFEREVHANNIGNGVAFVIPNVIPITQKGVINLKVSLDNSSWASLHQPGRNYLKNPPQRTNDKEYGINIVEQALRKVFHEGIQRKDGTRGNKQWYVKKVGFIQHMQSLEENQRYHVDNHHHYNRMKIWKKENSTSPTSPVTFYDYSGFSVFLGLEKKNVLMVADYDEDTERIINSNQMEFPFKSILVISSHKLHHGCKFQGVNSIHSDRHPNSTYSIKGFISLSDNAEEEDNLQRFFNNNDT